MYTRMISKSLGFSFNCENAELLKFIVISECCQTLNFNNKRLNDVFKCECFLIVI